MRPDDKIFLQLLKKEIATVMKISYPGINSEISEWKGQEITDFQEELHNKVNGHLSEKWFYTHVKSTGKSLPRIDVLNMLSQYAGYLNWNDFRHKNMKQVPLAFKLQESNSIFIKVPLLMLLVVVLLIILFRIINTQNYRFTFIDADTGEPVRGNVIKADLLLQNESPISYLSDNDGIITLRTDQGRIKLAVFAPYYLPDTLTRTLKKFNRTEQIRLNVDSYALMIKFFSQEDVKGWQKRRDQLNNIISDEAMIFQLPDNNERTGMELFNKQEFIDKLTMPVSSLGQIEIMDSKYHQGKIVVLRYKVNKKKDEVDR